MLSYHSNDSVVYKIPQHTSLLGLSLPCEILSVTQVNRRCVALSIHTNTHTHSYTKYHEPTITIGFNKLCLLSVCVCVFVSLCVYVVRVRFLRVICWICVYETTNQCLVWLRLWSECEICIEVISRRPLHTGYFNHHLKKYSFSLFGLMTTLNGTFGYNIWTNYIFCCKHFFNFVTKTIKH